MVSSRDFQIPLVSEQALLQNRTSAPRLKPPGSKRSFDFVTPFFFFFFFRHAGSFSGFMLLLFCLLPLNTLWDQGVTSQTDGEQTSYG